MTDVNFQLLFKYLDEHLGAIKADIKSVDEKVNTLQTSVDGLTKLIMNFQD